MSCKFRKKPYHPAPVTFRPGLPQDHAKQSGVGEELGTDNTTLCRDATSKTAEARHESGAQQIPLLLGALPTWAQMPCQCARSTFLQPIKEILIHS